MFTDRTQGFLCGLFVALICYGCFHRDHHHRHLHEARRLSSVSCGSSSAAAGWSASDGRLQGMLHLAHLDEAGGLRVPPGAKIVLEIGANSRDTADRGLLPLDERTFLVTFEPLLDKWGTLLSRNSHADTMAPLGSHHPRGVVLPFAVSEKRNAQVELKISGEIDGCASLLEAKRGYFSTSCTNASGTLDSRAVPTISLEAVLDVLLRGRDVEFAKIDAQGMDVAVLRSAGTALRRIKAVQLEVVRSRAPLPCPVQPVGPGSNRAPHPLPGAKCRPSWQLPLRLQVPAPRHARASCTTAQVRGCRGVQVPGDGERARSPWLRAVWHQLHVACLHGRARV